MDISAISLSGMQAAQQSLETAARRIASPPDPSTDTVDLSTEMVAMMNARNQFSANAEADRTAQEMEKRTLDLFA